MRRPSLPWTRRPRRQRRRPPNPRPRPRRQAPRRPSRPSASRRAAPPAPRHGRCWSCSWSRSRSWAASGCPGTFGGARASSKGRAGRASSRLMHRNVVAPLAALLLALAPATAGIALAVPPPSASDDTYATDEDTQLDVSAPGVLENDGTPGDGNVLCVGSVDKSNLHGSLDWNADGSFSYSPPANYHGAGSGNSFTYTMYEVATDAACEGNNGSTGTVE